MAYVPFTNDYSNARPAEMAAVLARRTAVQSRVNDIFTQGNAVMGGLIADCCSDPAYGGQGFYDDSSGAFGTPGSTAADPMGVLPAPGVPYPLTPVDILTGGYGFPVRKDGRPWPRPRIAGRFRRAAVAGFPNLGPGTEVARLVPPCPCFAPTPSVPVPVARPSAPSPAAPAPAAVPCPYPACSTGNVCLDLVTGCVLNSQIDTAQQTACALANYGVFGNKGLFLAEILHGCQPPKYLGTPLPNPPPATPDMMAQINAVVAKKGVSGLGQVDCSNVGGFLAIVGLFGIVVWATRK